MPAPAPEPGPTGASSAGPPGDAPLAATGASGAATLTPEVLAERYGRPVGPPGARPVVRVVMVASLDGAVSVGGVVGPLGGGPDHEVFHGLRALSDAVVVGAGTVRAEGYGPVRASDAWVRWRTDHGLAPHPPLVVVSGSCDLDLDGPAFTGAPVRPVVVTGRNTATPARRAAAAAVADVVDAGTDRVDLARALDALGARGLRTLAVEGGPTLNAQLADEDLLDEWCLTVAPLLVGGAGPRAVEPAAGLGPWRHRYRLVGVWPCGDVVFLRHARRRGPAVDGS